MKPKFWLDSLTVKSGLFVTLAGVILIALNPATSILSRNNPARAEDYRDFKELIESLIYFSVTGGGISTVLAKVGSKAPAYTPDGWYGNNKSDFAPPGIVTRIDTITPPPDSYDQIDKGF